MSTIEKNLGLLPLLEKHGLFNQADEFRFLVNVGNSKPVSNKQDLVEVNNQLIEFNKQIESNIKAHLDSHHITVKTVLIAWLSTICDIETHPNAHKWAFASWDQEKIEIGTFYFIEGTQSNFLSLSERVYQAFEDYPEKTLDAARLANNIHTMITSQSQTYTQPDRLEKYLIFPYRKNSSDSRQQVYNPEILKKIISPTHPESANFVIDQIRVIDLYIFGNENEKARIIKTIHKLSEIIKLDNQIQQKYRGNLAFLNAANEYFRLERGDFEKITDIFNHTDLVLRFNPDSLEKRKRFYLDIEKKYLKKIKKNPDSRAQTFTLTKIELEALDFISKTSKAPQSTALRESIRYATSECRENKKNTDVKDCISEQRSSPSTKTFKLDINTQKNIDRLLKAIAATKVQPPRALNKSLAVGIAIRLYARSKRNRRMAYSGEKIASTDS